MSVLSQLIFFSVLGALVLGIFLFTKEPHKKILGFAIAITPWQGGLWIESLQMDFRFSYILYCLVTIIVLFQIRSRSFLRRIDFPILLPTLGLVFCAVISAVQAIDQKSAYGGIVMLIVYFIVFFAIIDTLHKPSDLKYVFYPLLASLIFQSLLGLVQYKFSHFRLGIIDQAQSGMWWRAKGTFFHANQYGMYLALTIPLVFRLYLMYNTSKNMLLKYSYLAGFAVSTVALLASQSRGSWVGISIGAILVLLYELLQNRSGMLHKFVKLTIPIMIFFFLLSLRFGDLLLNRIFRDDTTLQFEGRIGLQNEAMGLIQANPLGVGIRNYKNHISHEFVHNLFLLIASEVGIIGSIFFIWILFVIFLRIIRCTRRSVMPINNLGLSILVSFFAFIIASMAGPDYWIDYSVAMSFWILAGLVVVLNRMADRIVQSQNAPRLSMKAKGVA